MSSMLLALIAGVANGIADFIIKLTSGKISPYLSIIIFSLTTIVVVGFYLVFVKGLDGIYITKTGALYSVAAGVVISASMIAFWLLLGQANLSTFQPISKTLVILTAVILGVVFLREGLNAYQILGIVLSLAGIYFLTR